jgi:hypothetical protein
MWRLLEHFKENLECLGPDESWHDLVPDRRALAECLSYEASWLR